MDQGRRNSGDKVPRERNFWAEDDPAEEAEESNKNEPGPQHHDTVSRPPPEPFQNELEGVLNTAAEEAFAKERSLGARADRKGWDEARDAVANFKPIPWFIWRISNYVFSGGTGARTISDGLVFGLRKILIAAASDKVLGSNRPVTTTREALRILPHDVAAAVCVLHSISRRLSSLANERIWGPLLDDAIIRAHIGFYVGQMNLDFGPGRGMLAGFAGRIGLAIMIAQGSEKQGYDALASLARGGQIKEVGEDIYELDPLKIAAMTLSASGCGKNAAFGTVSYASAEAVSEISNGEQLRWLAAFSTIESARMGTLENVDQKLWETLGYYGDEEKTALHDLVAILVREGHGWHWIR